MQRDRAIVGLAKKIWELLMILPENDRVKPDEKDYEECQDEAEIYRAILHRASG